MDQPAAWAAFVGAIVCVAMARKIMNGGNVAAPAPAVAGEPQRSHTDTQRRLADGVSPALI